jgi:lipopolysaccharide/colanic/teichoic acid biosynthesis glycosyltransferase
MRKYSFKQILRFLILQVILTYITIQYFDRFLIGDFTYGYDVIIKNLLEDRLRFFPFIPYDLITIDFFLAIFVFIFLIILTSSKDYSYVNEFDFAINKNFYSEFLSIFLLWSSSFLVFLQLFRFTVVSRGYLIPFVIFVPVLLTLLRNSENISSLLGRSTSDENFITFNLDSNSTFRNLRIMKFRKILASYETKEENSFKEIESLIEALNKKNNLNLIVINLEKTIKIPESFEKYLLNLNKKILILSSKPLIFKNRFIHRSQVINNRYMTYINNDIQYGSRYIVKRLVDIFVALLGIILFSPIFLIISIYILLKDGRPLVVKQNRVGLHGKPFRMYKFRTMKKDSHSKRTDLKDLNTQKGPLFKIDKDPRLLKGAEKIRKYSLDELPQFLNVVLGSMSIVGPRPLFVEDSKYFNDKYLRRLNVLPGITGLLQINNRNTDDFDIWYKYDLEYLENWSIGLDLEIMIKTPFSLFKRETLGK